MSVKLECYTTRLPKAVKESIKILAEDNKCSQQTLITKLVTKELINNLAAKEL